MRPSRVRPLLRVRPAVLLAATVFATISYTVEAGDTLSELAERFDLSVDALAEAGDLEDPDHLIVGTRLDIPHADTPVDPEPAGEVAPPAAAAARADVGALLERTARAHGWSPAFVKALAWQESGWDQQRVSRVGAIGIMQVMPETGEFVSTHLAGRQLDLHDPRDNVLAGVLFLDHLHDLTDGDAERILAGYYQGLRSVREHDRYRGTDRYIANVLALRERFR